MKKSTKTSPKMIKIDNICPQASKAITISNQWTLKIFENLENPWKYLPRHKSTKTNQTYVKSSKQINEKWQATIPSIKIRTRNPNRQTCRKHRQKTCVAINLNGSAAVLRTSIPTGFHKTIPCYQKRAESMMQCEKSWTHSLSNMYSKRSIVYLERFT